MHAITMRLAPTMLIASVYYRYLIFYTARYMVGIIRQSLLYPHVSTQSMHACIYRVILQLQPAYKSVCYSDQYMLPKNLYTGHRSPLVVCIIGLINNQG